MNNLKYKIKRQMFTPLYSFQKITEIFSGMKNFNTSMDQLSMEQPHETAMEELPPKKTSQQNNTSPLLN